MTVQNKAALAAGILAIPMGLLILGIFFGATPIESALKSVLTIDGNTPNLFGRIFMFMALFGLPVGLLVTLWPMAKKGTDGKRKAYPINIVVAIIIALMMIPTWGGLAQDIYRCDILKIPNCD